MKHAKRPVVRLPRTGGFISDPRLPKKLRNTPVGVLTDPKHRAYVYVGILSHFSAESGPRALIQSFVNLDRDMLYVRYQEIDTRLKSYGLIYKDVGGGGEYCKYQTHLLFSRDMARYNTLTVAEKYIPINLEYSALFQNDSLERTIRTLQTRIPEIFGKLPKATDKETRVHFRDIDTPVVRRLIDWTKSGDIQESDLPCVCPWVVLVVLLLMDFKMSLPNRKSIGTKLGAWDGMPSSSTRRRPDIFLGVKWLHEDDAF